MTKPLFILLAVALSSVTALSSLAQDQVVKKIIEIGNSDNRAMEHLDVLSNRIGGRLIGSNAYDNAVRWTADEFRKWGMEVIVEECGTMPVGFNRGPWFGRMLSHDGMVLHFVTPSYTSGTKGVQRGHVVAEPTSRAEFERMKHKLKGAWVLTSGANRGWPIDRSTKGDSVRKVAILQNKAATKHNDSVRRKNWRNDISLYQSQLKTLSKEPALFYNEMIEAGALGFIQSSPVPITALYDKECMTNMTFENLPKVPDIKLDEEQFAIIAKKVKRMEYFELEFDIRNHFRPGPVPYHNVIAILRGSEKPNEYVISGGHLDAFDVATGGVDCGSGSSANMEAARLIMKAADGKRPRRSIVIGLWAGEEFGLLGSKCFVENRTKEHTHMSNYFNRDGGPLASNSLTVSEAMYPVFERVCKVLLDGDAIADTAYKFTLNKRSGKAPKRPVTAGGSDHAHFAINGIPTVSFGTSDYKGYNFNYREIWHTESDLYDRSIAEYQEQSAVVMAIVLWNLANEKEILPREGLYSN